MVELILVGWSGGVMVWGTGSGYNISIIFISILLYNGRIIVNK
jgi:hypothetical protein